MSHILLASFNPACLECDDFGESLKFLIASFAAVIAIASSSDVAQGEGNPEDGSRILELLIHFNRDMFIVVNAMNEWQMSVHKM